MELIVRHYHSISGHSGQEYVLSLARQKFWLIKGRTTVRKVLKNCFKCKQLWKSSSEQKMADLPEDRVTPGKTPFSYVGVDCFGSIVKRYGVLFTCLSSHAVHIEVVHTLDTDAFINAMRRFIARRGKPVQMRSDNDSTFVKGDKELRETIGKWNQEQIHDFLLQNSASRLEIQPPQQHLIWVEYGKGSFVLFAKS